MAVYDNTKTLNEALETYFKNYNLGKDGGLNKKWGKIKIGPIYIPIPNPKSRQKALVFHDMHHIATGYDGDWKGEVSISAWEIASGCENYYAAWILDLWGMAVGLFLYPKHVFNAFIRGKRSLNLYHHLLSEEDAHAMRIDELQNKLQLNSLNKEKANAKELFSFMIWATISFLFFFIPFILPYVIFICWILNK